MMVAKWKEAVGSDSDLEATGWSEARVRVTQVTANGEEWIWWLASCSKGLRLEQGSVKAQLPRQSVQEACKPTLAVRGDEHKEMRASRGFCKTLLEREDSAFTRLVPGRQQRCIQ